MATHLVNATHPVVTGHADAARPASVSAFAPYATAYPMFAAPAPEVTQLKATWRKTTAVRCTSTGMNPAGTSTDGTDIATRRPPGGT